jgi:hypothetical protein
VDGGVGVIADIGERNLEGSKARSAYSHVIRHMPVLIILF